MMRISFKAMSIALCLILIEMPVARAEASACNYRRVGGAEIQRVLIDRYVHYEGEQRGYLGAVWESFYSRPNQYVIQYSNYKDGGRFLIRTDQLCVKSLSESEFRCRFVYSSARCGLAVSDDGIDAPSHRITRTTKFEGKRKLER